MKKTIRITAGIFTVLFLLSACKSMNKTQKGAVIGTAGGAAAGAVVGKVAGNTALGAIIGAAVGGVTGAVIGRKMDKQAEEIKKTVPGATVERVGEGIVVEFKDKILFGFDRSDLSGTAEGNLDKLVNVLKEYSNTDIEIQGHTDSKGSDSYNQTLSEKRAGSVASYIRNRGVSSARVTTKGYGESAPVASNDTEDGRSQNRRVNFLITANEKMKAEANKEAGTGK
ncbi:MAG: OmpA family protein [Chitinophagaceae bacterium]